MSETKSRAAECTVVQASKPFVGKQGFTYAPAVSAQTVGATGLHMQFITMPPGARAKTHNMNRTRPRSTSSAARAAPIMASDWSIT